MIGSTGRTGAAVRFLVTAVAMLAVVATLAAVAGIARAEEPADLDFPATEAEIAGHVRFLADPLLEGREAGARGGRIAAAYVAAEFRKLGLEPAGDDGDYLASFPIRIVEPDRDAGTIRVAKRTATNVVARLVGSDPELAEEWILVGAHFDHLGVDESGAVFRGADDNATGIAGLLAVAEALGREGARPRRTVVFAGFDAEEQGLRGAKAMLESPPLPIDDLIVMINLDMIGRPLFYDRQAVRGMRKFLKLDKPGVGLLGAESSPPLLAIAREACQAEKLAVFTLVDFPLLRPYLEPMTENRDDSAPFRAAGHATLFFSTSEHDDYHRPSDTPDKVDASVVLRVSRSVFHTVRAIDALDDAGVLRPEPESE